MGSVMMNFKRFILVCVLVFLPVVAEAQGDLAKNHPIQTDLTKNTLVKMLDPDLMQRAQNGDAYAAYEGGGITFLRPGKSPISKPLWIFLPQPIAVPTKPIAGCTLRRSRP
jgi:hypothetical protein